MLPKFTTWQRVTLVALALASTPVVMAGCSGGSSGGPSNRGTVRQSASLVGTLTELVGSQVPSTTTVNFPDGSGEIYRQQGSDSLRVTFKLKGQEGLGQTLLTIGTPGTLQTGQSFPLSAGEDPEAPGTPYRQFVFTDPNNTSFTQYQSTSGTFTLVSRSDVPARGSRPAYAKIKFNITNAQMYGLNSSDSGFIFNGSGECTVILTGESSAG